MKSCNRVDRARKIHHVGGVPITDRRQDQQLIRNEPARAVGHPSRADGIDVERQVRAVLLHRPTRDQANLFQINGVVDLGPGQLFVSIFGAGAAG